MKVSKNLLRAADLLAREGGWTQGEMARDAQGLRVCPTSPNAVSFDPEGAIRATAKCKVIALRAMEAVERVREEIHIDGLSMWNDWLNFQSEAVEVVREAALAESMMGR